MGKGNMREQSVEIIRASGQSKLSRSAKQARKETSVNGAQHRGNGEAARLRRNQAPAEGMAKSRRAEVDGLVELGQRLHPLLGCLDLFLDEARVVLGEVDEKASREDLSEKLRAVREIIDWSDAVAEDLHVEADRAMAGMCSVNSLELFRDAAEQMQTRSEGLDVVVASSGVVASCQGRPADLREAFSLGLSIVAQRIGGAGSLKVEIDPADGGWIAHRITGKGLASEDVSTDQTARLRTLLVDRHGARVIPDLLASGRVGMTILLPQRKQ